MDSVAGHGEPKPGSLYRQLILEHHRSPRNGGVLENPTVAVDVVNPTCGDEIRLTLRLEEGRIADVGHEGRGCSVSRAAASMMTERLRDLELGEALRLADVFTSMLHGDEEAAADRTLGDLRALAGVSRFPVRVKCALLGFDALRKALGEVDAAH